MCKFFTITPYHPDSNFNWKCFSCHERKVNQEWAFNDGDGKKGFILLCSVCGNHRSLLRKMSKGFDTITRNEPFIFNPTVEDLAILIDYDRRVPLNHENT